MDAGKAPLLKFIQFRLGDGRCRVVGEQSAQKVGLDRRNLARLIESAALEIQQLRELHRQKKDSTPQDVKDLVDLGRVYRLESLEHRYRCLRLAEYILELHSVHGAHGSLQTLPPVPAEITWYLDMTTLEA